MGGLMIKGVFGLPPGADFPRLFVHGLQARLAGQPPEAAARVTVFVNTQRMRRAMMGHLTAGGAALMPKIRLVTDLARDALYHDVPAPVSPLRRRLELSQLVRALLDRAPTLAAQSSVFDLADSLAALMDEMRGEGVPPDRIAALDVSGHSEHWKRTQDFIGIIGQFFTDDAAPDVEARQRLVVARLIAGWHLNPPADPVIVAGSTGSRGTTAILMRAVAELPQGVLVLPGYDFDMPDAVWAQLDEAGTGEDHPQFRYRRLLAGSDLPPVALWLDNHPPNPARNRLISLSLRPAPVTDQWMVEGQLLGDLGVATADMTLIEAPSPRAEAVAVALILRDAAERGRRAALMTPDRNLSRQVTAMLDLWRIQPDDSAGEPLSLSATGRFLRHVADLFGQRMTGEMLLALLKHPVTAAGADRALHLRMTQGFERFLRAKGAPFPDTAMLAEWGAGRPAALPWARWLTGVMDGLDRWGDRPLTTLVERHLAVAEILSAGDGGDRPMLWTTVDGLQARQAMADLAAAADAAGTVSPQQYRDILRAVLDGGEVRRQGQIRLETMIWGTREARIQGADLVILGGMNDGIWPALPPPDPWLNRDMRLKAGLLLPERRIGLSAHDYQQAICAAEVVVTRAKRDAQAETVASRWINRLTNLLSGLPNQDGPAALAAMVRRGNVWLNLAAALDAPGDTVKPAPRPSPRPPVTHRPKELPVTSITRLVRDPYHVYARNILRLKPLDPLRPGADPRLRGQVLHRILESFVRHQHTAEDPKARLMAIADAVLAEEVAWPSVRALWLAKLDRAADFFLAENARHGGRPVLIEKGAGIDLPGLDFRLTAKPDRIDVLPDGRLHLIDYKTGTPPTKEQQAVFDNQLLLEACMATRGAFGPDLPTDVASVAYIGLGASPSVNLTVITDEILGRTWAQLSTLIERYGQREVGYTARRAVFEDHKVNDYDHLARHGEWDVSMRAVGQDVGGDA
jgi:ATP-dependent helicase/nuclease subunit B